MTSSHYSRTHLPAFGDIGEAATVLADKFFAYYGAVFQPGALTVREKKLTALTVAHAVQCPYCIDAYTTGSLEAGADLEELTECAHVAASVRAGGTHALSMQMLGQAAKTSMSSDALSGIVVSPSYYDRTHADVRDDAMAAASELGSRYAAFEHAVFEESALSSQLKHVMASACAQALHEPYGIQVFTQRAIECDADLETLTEAAHVAAAIRGGASLIHGIQMREAAKEKLGL